MAKFCPECGTAANGGKFCAECGTRFQDNADAMAANGSSPAATTVARAAMANGHGGAYTPPWATAAGAAPAQTGHRPYVPTPMQAPPPPPPPPPLAPAPAAAPWATPAAAAAAAPVGAAASAAGGANGSLRGSFNNNGSSSLFKPPLPLPLPLATTPPPEPVPPAAAGLEAQECYERCVQTIRASRGGQNEAGVKAFKQNCRLYGLKEMPVVAFYESLVHELGPEATLAFVPELARLVPDDDRRRELVLFNAQRRPLPVARPRGDSSSSSGSFYDPGSNPQQRPSLVGAGASSSSSSRGILKGRYADHPNCDICNGVFDVTKRRHQCRHCGLAICSSCSPLRLLIPPGKEVSGAKGYDPSIPQRVCIQCAPQLHPFQDELVAQYAKANEDNMYEARGRIHVPFSSSLFKECQNAADIIGNFFRDDWGATADRSIPVAFLQRAHGFAVMTIAKAGFLVTGQIGTGLVVAKLPDGTWSAPSAIGTVGLGGGFEIGGELVELMIILGSEGAVRVFHKPQVNLGAGLDIAVGPFGRSAAAAAAASASGLNANYSYSHSKGLYAGISLQGTIIAARSDLNRKFYGRDLQPSEILSGHVAPPNAARPLYEAIAHAMQGVEVHKEIVAQRASIMGPCRLCNCPMFVAHTHQVWNKNCKTCKHIH